MPPFLHSCIDRHLGGFHILAFVSSATMNLGVQLSPRHTDFLSCGYTNSGIAGSLEFIRLQKLHMGEKLQKYGEGGMCFIQASSLQL